MPNAQSKAPFSVLLASLALLLLAPALLPAQSSPSQSRPAQSTPAQSAQTSPDPSRADPSTLSVSTQLVVLDATVLDHQGRIVNQPLTRDDFQVTEDKTPQKIYYFESAIEHATESSAGDPKKAPLLIAVLDELNFRYQTALDPTRNMLLQFGDEAFERKELAAFLGTQPAQLLNPTEILVLTHHGYQVLAQPTLDRDAVLDKLKRHNPAIPEPYRDYLEDTGGFSQNADHTLVIKSLEAIWALALQQRSQPGRKLVLWLGYGGPSLNAKPTRPGRPLQPLERYIRQITDLLVDARITLNVFYPGIDETPPPPTDIQNDNFAINAVIEQSGGQDTGFASYVSATGGFKRESNDIRGELTRSVNYGSTYYTVSYHPTSHLVENQYRDIKITIKDHPDWTVLTKKGYYAMHFGGERDAAHQMLDDVSLATFEPMPFSAIGATLTKIERYAGSNRVRFTFQVESTDLQWPIDAASGQRQANVLISGAALGSRYDKKTLAFQGRTWNLSAPATLPESKIKSAVAITLDVPSKTKSLPLIVMGPEAEDEFILQAVSAGAKAYLNATASPKQVEQAVEIVSQGSIWAPRRVLALFVDRAMRKTRIATPDRVQFTLRETEVLRLLVNARSNREIARKMGIEERTVKAHVAKLMRKVGVENRIALSIYAVNNEIVTREAE